MNKLTFKIMNPQQNTSMTIDGQNIKPQKDKGGHDVYTFETERSSVDIILNKYLEVNSSFYIFWQILFFIISLFGICNKRLDKNCVVLKYHATIKVNENTEVTARIKTGYKETQALNLETTAEVMEDVNERFVDKNAKKRLKALKIIKIGLWIALIAMIIVLIMNRQ